MTHQPGHYHDPAAEPPNTLLPCQREVAALIAQGLDNKEIAVRRVCSVITVRNHIADIFERLGLRNRTEVALWYWGHLEARR